MRTMALVVVAMLLSAGSAAAGPWTQGFGGLYLELKLSHWQADERFVGAGTQTLDAEGDLPELGERVPLGTDVDGAELVYQTAALYLEFGLLDQLDLTVWLPLIRAEFTDDVSGFETVGSGDPQIGLKWHVAGPIAAWTDVKIPVSEVPREAELPISEDQFDWTLGLDLGASLPAGWGWAGLRLGYRLRFARTEDLPPEEGGFLRFNPGDEFIWLADLGLRLAPLSTALDWLVLRVQADGLHGQDGESQDQEGGLVFQTARRELVSLRGGLLLQQWGLGLEVMGGYPVFGRNFPAGPTAQIGLSYRLDLF